MLLSRDLKRNKKRLIRVCQWMIFAARVRHVLADRAELQRRRAQPALQLGNSRVHCGACVAMFAFWVAYFCMQLKTRPLVQVNDPHLAEILEPEHVHA